jgi:hypothetical protein
VAEGKMVFSLPINKMNVFVQSDNRNASPNDDETVLSSTASTFTSMTEDKLEYPSPTSVATKSPALERGSSTSRSEAGWVEDDVSVGSVIDDGGGKTGGNDGPTLNNKNIWLSATVVTIVGVTTYALLLASRPRMR